MQVNDLDSSLGPMREHSGASSGKLTAGSDKKPKGNYRLWGLWVTLSDQKAKPVTVTRPRHDDRSTPSMDSVQIDLDTSRRSDDHPKKVCWGHA